MLKQIATRRKALEQSSGQDWKVDILSLLLACTDEQGQGLSDDELHDELLTLLFAGHETTATALTWALYWIHRHPSVRQRLLDELKAMREPADPEAIAKLPYLSAVVNEVLRIHPVAMLMFPRRIEAAISLGGGLFRSWRCGAELHSGAASVLLWPSTSWNSFWRSCCRELSSGSPQSVIAPTGHADVASPSGLPFP